MTCSMTAFAREERPVETGVLGCEIKTVNHRYLDVSVRTASPLRSLEPDIIKAIREKVARGRVECLFLVQTDDARPQVDVAALTALAEEIHKTEDKLHSLGMDSSPVSALDAMKWSGVTSTGEPDAERLCADAMQLLDKTLDNLVKSRREEGARLEKFILGHCAELQKVISRLRKHYPKALAEARKKFDRRLAEIKTEVDPERLAQEAALLAQKFCIGADIEEELNRCASHMQELKAIFKRKEPIGRRLDFLMQELNREANTISSKSADIETTHTAVEAKTLIEQMREQIQNIE